MLRQARLTLTVLVTMLAMVMSVVFSAGADHNPPGTPGGPGPGNSTVDIEIKFPGSNLHPLADADGYLDPDDFPGRDIDVCGAGVSGGVSVAGAKLLVRLKVGPVGTGGTQPLVVTFQPQGGRQAFVPQGTNNAFGEPSATNVATVVDGAKITIADPQDGDVFILEFLNKQGHNVIGASITGGGGTGSDVEVNTVGVCLPPGGGGPGPEPCPNGSLTKEAGAISLAPNPLVLPFPPLPINISGRVYHDPTELKGPGKGGLGVPAGNRVTIQTGASGTNTVVYVRQGELVVNAIFINGISASLAPLVLEDRYQSSYQRVVEVRDESGLLATKLATNTPLGTILTSGFSYTDDGSKIRVYNVPTDGAGSFKDVYVVTEILKSAGYITNNVGVAGRLTGTGASTRLTPISGICGDSMETGIFGGARPTPATLPGATSETLQEVMDRLS